MKNVYRDSVKIKKGICGALIAVGMTIMTGCGERAIAPEVSDMAETAQDSLSAVETGSQPERETVSVMGSVPYFKDDAGTNTQTVDGWIYGYWYNRLCRYDPETLEETVLYEAASPQNGDFCIWGDYVYFMDVPKVNAVEKLHGYLCRVPCDGSGEAVRIASVPMPEQMYGGCYYADYKLDTYEDILYLICQGDQAENLYFRLDREGNITWADESETLYGRLPEGEFYGWFYDDQMTLPYAMRNYGYVFMTDADRNPVRIDLESRQIERMGIISSIDIKAVTNDSFIYGRGGDWYKASLDDLNDIQDLGKIMDGGWENHNPQLAAWNEEGLYFTIGNEEYDGNLFFVDWGGEWTSMGGNYFSNILMNTDSPIVHFNGQYYYYVADQKGVALVRRLKLTDEKEKVYEEVAVYSREPGCEIAEKERIDCTWEDIYIRAWVKYSMAKVIFKEDTAAFDKINGFLEDLYAQDTALVEEYQEAAKENSDEEWIDYVELSHSYDVCYLDEDYVGIVLDWEEYWRGGAHGIYGTVYYMFDRHTGNRVAITDVIDRSPEELCEIIAPYVETAAEWGTDQEGWETAVLQTGRFYLTEEGIGIHFDVYELSAYANGARDVIVPYSAFSD